MNRTDFQKLAEIRLQEAKALLDAEKFDGAYYLCGYAVECALKACIAKQTKEHDFPDVKIVQKSYTHNLENLLDLSGLKSDLDNKIKDDKEFDNFWSIVKDWNENSRYEFLPNKKSRDLYEAIANIEKGVLQWIKQRW